MAYFANRNFGLCRALTGHAWELDSPRAPIVPEGSERYIDLICTRCAATRRDWVSLSTGEVQGRSYRYATGYKIPTGERGKQVSKSTLRKEVFGMLKQAVSKKNGE